MSLRTKIAAVAMTAAMAAAATGCAASTGQNSGASDSEKTLTVFAAASLKAPFTKLATTFEESHPGTKVALSFAGSSDLVTQISQGAPADVFASADTKNMAKLADAGLLDGAAANFATNVLAIAVPPANPASIASFADLARPGVRVVVCAGQVPCGTATAAVEKATGVTLKPVSEESSVTDVLGKVTSGEADAGIVYVTDVRAAGDKVKGIPFAEADKAINTYPIATVGSSKNKELAAAFNALVTGAEGKKVLSDAGFGAP
jgi:molybdate transport system substrate-binding protein